MPFPNDNTMSVGELRRLMAEFVTERDWQQFHRPKNLAMSLAIEAGELMEHFQWLDHEQSDAALADPGTRREIADEMADVLSFLLSLANATGIDLSQAFADKLESNRRKYPAEEVRGDYRKRGKPQP